MWVGDNKVEAGACGLWLKKYLKFKNMGKDRLGGKLQGIKIWEVFYVVIENFCRQISIWEWNWARYWSLETIALG